jgi:hypothetical protein
MGRLKKVSGIPDTFEGGGIIFDLARVKIIGWFGDR